MTRRTPKPRWLSRKIPSPGLSSRVSGLLKDLSLHTVCQEAICPNQGECFGHGTHLPAARPKLHPKLRLLRREKGTSGSTAGNGTGPDRSGGISNGFEILRSDHGYSGRSARRGSRACRQHHLCLEKSLPRCCALRNRCPDVGVEVLISDFGGSETALMTVLETQPEVLNHNIETVSRLYPEVRPQADYRRSLELLARADSYRPKLVTKSGMMLGLGETRDEVLEAMDGLRAAGCDLLTLGQYLCPSEKHHPVARYVPPEEFDELKTEALKKGFTDVASGPYVRSSYKAEDLFKRALAAWS